MPADEQFVAEVLRSAARAHASAAVDSLLQKRPELSDRAGAFARWHEVLTARVHELAVAVEFGEPTILHASIGWSADALKARGINTEDVRASVTLLGETLGDTLDADAALVVRRVLDEATREVDAEVVEPSSPERGRHESVLRYLEAVLGGRRRDAVRLVLDELERGESQSSLIEQVLLPAQAEVGRLWHVGELSITEEHAATEMTRGVLAVLSDHCAPAPARGERVLVGAVEGDRHDIGVRAVVDLLEAAGFPVVGLGADIPVSEFASAVRDYEAAMLMAGASLPIFLPTLRATVAAARAACGGDLFVVVGGPAVSPPRLVEKLGADAFAGSVSEAVRLAEARFPRS